MTYSELVATVAGRLRKSAPDVAVVLDTAAVVRKEFAARDKADLAAAKKAAGEKAAATKKRKAAAATKKVAKPSSSKGKK